MGLLISVGHQGAWLGVQVAPIDIVVTNVEAGGKRHDGSHNSSDVL